LVFAAFTARAFAKLAANFARAAAESFRFALGAAFCADGLFPERYFAQRFFCAVAMRARADAESGFLSTQGETTLAQRRTSGGNAKTAFRRAENVRLFHNSNLTDGATETKPKTGLPGYRKSMLVARVFRYQ